MLVGLTILEKAESGDGEAWFGFPNLDIDKVDFTLLTTSLSYENIYSYVGLSDRRDIDAENVNVGNIKNIIRWLYVKDEEGETIVGDSRNISMLAAVVGRPDSLEDLIENKDLEAAFNLTSGPDEALQLALTDAHKLLEQAYRLLARARSPNSTHLDQAELNFDISRTIRNVLRDKIEDAR
ncbi:hypothetical protein DBR44_00390 [Aquitalea sp. FJL05]|nr:hypothetical protein DBR44_00390 [Aquitalea sp. FJL05]